MRPIISTLSFFLLVLNLQADPVDSTEAKQVALNFYRHFNPERSYIPIQKTITKQYKGTCTRYTIVFENWDFVIVSGDNSTVPIFAYSNEGSYRENDLPPSFEYWLQTEYDELVHYVQSNNIENTATIDLWEDLNNNIFDISRSSVSPLLSSTWGQSFPNDGVFECAYNFFVQSGSCGCGNCTAGCVAVAMGQIMNFWQMPDNIFDWCLMPDELITTTPNYSNERNAVATLLSNCGDKADMEYCSNGCASSSTLGNARQALQNDYNYSNDMLHRMRVYTVSWKPKMRNSLDDGDPILYGGNSDNGGGHAFVCDGYENDNYFHFNWGWTGASDGYFYIDDDDGSPVITYKNWQEAIFYIHPENTTSINCIDCEQIITVSNTVINPNPHSPFYPMLIWSGISPLYNYLMFISPFKPVFSNIISSSGGIRLEYFDITAGSVTINQASIPDKINVHFKGYHEVVFNPGFQTEFGAEMTAEIIDCPNFSSRSLISSNIKQESINGLMPFSINSKAYLAPNPCSQNSFLYFEILEDEFVDISILNIFGQKVKQVKFGWLKAGKYQSELDISNFPDGMYFVSIKNDEMDTSLKLLKAPN